MYRRFSLTKIMFAHLAGTVTAARELGVDVQPIVIGDDDNLQVAEDLNFHTITAPNALGSKYNDGHEAAVNLGCDYSLQANSDQIFIPELFAKIAQCPNGAMIRTTAITLVHGSGKRAISYRNPVWAMKAYPTDLLRTVPRPCDEHIMSMCDSSTHLGVAERHPDAPTVTVDSGMFQTVQFESGFQVTDWRNWVRIAAVVGITEMPVPWVELEIVHGKSIVQTMKEFYGVKP